jgi:hypothetical protein
MASVHGTCSTRRRYPAVTQPDFESVAQTVSPVVRLAAVKKWHDDCTRNNLYRSLDYAQTSHDKSTTIFNLDNDYFWDVGAPRKPSRPLNSSPCSEAHALDHARSFHSARLRNQRRPGSTAPPQTPGSHLPPIFSNLEAARAIHPHYSSSSHTQTSRVISPPSPYSDLAVHTLYRIWPTTHDLRKNNVHFRDHL